MISLNEDQLDALNEMINMGVGTAINSLNDLVHSYIKLSIPQIQLVHRNDLLTHLGPHKYSIILQSFEGSFEGIASLAFDQNMAKQLVAAIIEVPLDSPLLDTSISETLSEVGNIVINSLIGHISNLLNTKLRFKLPYYTIGNIKELSKHFYVNNQENILLIATTKFDIESIHVEGYILLSFPSQSLEKLLELIFESFDKNE